MDIKKEMRQNLLNLIEKYLDGSATDQEIKFLINYYESFQKISDWTDELGSKELIKEKMLLRLQKSLIEEKQREKKLRKINTPNIFKYAAIFVGVIGLSYFFVNNLTSVSQSALIIPNEDITLQLENGSTKKIDLVAGVQNILDSNGEVISVQKEGKLLYSNTIQSEKLAYNELKVPLGKRFQVVLSDGTKVHLNAGTSFKYPVKFIEGNDRQVFLHGEAYFDVAKDKEHPFIVNTSDIDVRVLGTQFNVSSYVDDDQINTVLVEGSVSVYESSDKYDVKNVSVIEPGHSAVWNKNQKNITIDKVNTEIHTAWITGKLLLKNTSFKNIRKKLERQYNVTIINKNKLLDDQIFNINFDAENIEQVLKTLNESFEINYKIINNQIIIN